MNKIICLTVLSALCLSGFTFASEVVSVMDIICQIEPLNPKCTNIVH